MTQSCSTSTSFNNTYFVNDGYPALFGGGSICNMVVTRSSSDVCQLRVDFLDFELAQPTGDGVCFYDYFQITGGSSSVPKICGKNFGQHVYVNFNGNSPLTVTVATSSASSVNRRWNLQLQMIGCDSLAKAPVGCLQYWQEPSWNIKSFNYDSTGAGTFNSIGVQGSRQIATLYYGACVRAQPGACTITWTIVSMKSSFKKIVHITLQFNNNLIQAAGDPYAFTLTGDVGGVAPATLGTAALLQTACTTDFVSIPVASQLISLARGGTIAAGDRFCGLGFQNTTSNVFPFVIYTRTDGNETPDIGNRGWSLTYTQNMCPV